MLKTPPLQTATATIDTLCGRLQSATLLEDRRAAILGLRSFAKQYPASVASGSLRELIATLRRDGLGEVGSTKGDDVKQTAGAVGPGDVDTIRLVLETLLTLFHPDSSSPEASDDIAFFMADEFSMRQDNILMLLSLLDPTSPHADYYSRLYSVQLLSAIGATRLERLQECILSAPLGISRLVGVLDDGRDAIRNAGLLLLVDLTTGADEDLRKIVAFEDVFVKTLGLLRAEGGLAEAGITAQDCLSLMANLVKDSVTNQTMFRESGCVNQMVELLQQASPPTASEPPYIAQAREKATWGLLQLLNLFLIPGEANIAQNQAAFFRAGTAQILIDLGFSSQLHPRVSTLALSCVADLIQGNAPLQEAFAGLTVATPADANAAPKASQQTNGTPSGTPSGRTSARVSVEKPRTYIIEALLDLCLLQIHEELSLRTAACILIQAYLKNHERIKAHFLDRALAGHAQKEAAANVLTLLLRPAEDASATTFACWIACDLIEDQPQAKATLSSVKEGNEIEGEDVLTAVQTVASQLQAALQVKDDRLVAAYSSLLIIFTWEFAQGVNDLLSEGSSLLQALAGAASQTSHSTLTAGLAAVLLGSIYEYSTKDSPITRRTLAPLLTQKVGRSKYLDALVQLRKHPAIRDQEFEDGADGNVKLCKPLVELFTVEYSRLRKAVDKDPGFEVLPPSAAEAGVDRDVLDDLRHQLQTIRDALSQAQQEALAVGQQHDQDRMAAAKELQTATAEVDRVRRINQAMQQNHEEELDKLNERHEKKMRAASAEHQRVVSAAKEETQLQVQTALRERESAAEEKSREYEKRLVELGNVHRAEQNAHRSTRDRLEALVVKHNDITTRERTLTNQLDELTSRHQKLQHEHRQLQMTSSQASTELERLRKLSEEQHDQIERLNAQIAELKDDIKGKDEELATERAGFADLESELEAAKLSAGGSDRSTAVEQQLAEAKEAEKSAKEELESMLLVMGDIEAKRDTYKARVRELGGTVSDEDDDEEDEEEGGAEGAEDDVD